ncbi:hypothetical protein BSU04_05925 [Caballeronia sordidicola]|uniref:Uncharacterized protein n=1 Tax=Caballeronia sordidicola TaxID=196367 RepID=A0A226X853_CABSO|nr:hypothetical protein BSU04_05925 [Caballeronia sordidicola]
MFTPPIWARKASIEYYLSTDLSIQNSAKPVRSAKIKLLHSDAA